MKRATIFVTLLFVLVMAACSTEPEVEATPVVITNIPPTLSPTLTPLPTKAPIPTSCVEVEGICLELSFDGESCTYEGPVELKPGQVTLHFFNYSEGYAAVNLRRHTGDQTIQDVLDTFVDGYTEESAPSLTVATPGVWKMTPSWGL